MLFNAAFVVVVVGVFVIYVATVSLLPMLSINERVYCILIWSTLLFTYTSTHYKSFLLFF